MNGYLTLTWSNVKSALIYGALVSLLTFAMAIGQDVLDAGSLFLVDWSESLDRGGVAVVGVLFSVVSIIKNLLTNAQGKFLGVVEVIPDKSPAAKK
jgi:hypothetical protein